MSISKTALVDLDDLLKEAEAYHLDLTKSPRTFPRMIQTRAHTKRVACKRPGVSRSLMLDLDASNLSEHRSFMSTVKKPQYLKGPYRPLVLELTEDLTIREEQVRAGQLMIGGGLHRIGAAWELGWTFIPCLKLTVDAPTAIRFLINENRSPYKQARTAGDQREKLLLHYQQHGVHASKSEAARMLGVSPGRIGQLRRLYPELRPDGSTDDRMESPEDRPVRLSRRAQAEAKRGLEELSQAAREGGPEDFVRVALDMLIRVCPDPNRLSELIGSTVDDIGIPTPTFEDKPLPMSFVSEVAMSSGEAA